MEPGEGGLHHTWVTPGVTRLTLAVGDLKLQTWAGLKGDRHNPPRGGEELSWVVFNASAGLPFWGSMIVSMLFL